MPIERLERTLIAPPLPVVLQWIKRELEICNRASVSLIKMAPPSSELEQSPNIRLAISRRPGVSTSRREQAACKTGEIGCANIGRSQISK
jgi:hypothetical protein